MNFELTTEQNSAILRGREFAEQEIAPIAVSLDREGKFNQDLFDKIARAGFFRVSVPKAYEGEGNGLFVRSLITAEFAKQCVSTAAMYTVAMGGLCVIKYYASEEQKQKYIPPMVRGESLGTFAFTEEGAGSDPGSMKTSAVKDGENFIINGKKAFITNGANANMHVLFALTSPENGTKGMSAFIVPKDETVVAGKIYDKIGMRSCQLAEVNFNKCVVPKENLIANENEGYKYAIHAINEGKVNVAFIALGLAERALAESIAYMKTRYQFGKAISANQGLQFEIADMVTEVEAAKLLSYKAAIAGDNKDPNFSNICSIAKYYATEMALRVTTKALHIHGANGLTTDYVVERLYRDQQGLRIYDGTSEIQKIIIAKNAMK